MANSFICVQSADSINFFVFLCDRPQCAQIVKNQLDRDRKIIDLLTSMEKVYSFVDEIQAVRDKNTTLDSVIKLILQQTFECAIFIQEYAGMGFAST